MVDQPSPLILPWFIRQNNYNKSITPQNNNKPLNQIKTLNIFFTYFQIFLNHKPRLRAKWAAMQVATRLADNKQIDNRTKRNQNRSAALGRPAMKLLEGWGLQLVCGRPTLALSSALVPQTLSCETDTFFLYILHHIK